MSWRCLFLANENLEVKEGVAVESNEIDAASREYVYENRRYVGMKETINTTRSIWIIDTYNGFAP